MGYECKSNFIFKFKLGVLHGKKALKYHLGKKNPAD
jgi:hypothetical protein